MTQGTDRSDGADAAAGPPGLPMPVLAYATPLGTGINAQGIWRDGGKLITTREAVLPQYCVKCNAPADGFYGQRKLYWYHPALALLILLNLLIFAIVAMILRKKATLMVGLCRRHHKRRLWLIATTWFFVLAGIVIMIGGPVEGMELREEWLVMAGLLGGLVLLIAALVAGLMARVLVPTKIDDRYAWFKGCGNEFLSQFPPAR